MSSSARDEGELEQSSDIELIARCRRGDERAFEVLYQRYRLPLYGYVNKLLDGDKSLGDDIFQQTWCKVLRSWDKYSDRQRFLAWLCRIAHNLVMDHFRRARWVSQDELSENDTISELSNSHEELVDKELQEALELAISSLPPEQREVVEYRRQGIGFSEIAASQGLSINTVLGRMHYAVKKLREVLHEHTV